MTNRFTVSRLGETGVLWLRFQSQKGNSGYRRWRMASTDAQAKTAIAPSKSFFLTDSSGRTLLLWLFLMVLTVSVYYPVHTHPFFGPDDALYVVDTEPLHHGLNWETIWWSFRVLYMGNWIPLTWMAHAVDHRLFGLNPAGHHMVNVLLHALNTALLFWVLKRATEYTGRSFLVAALFAMHPMNVEPVVWVAELKTMLSMTFFLLALAAYGWYARAPRNDGRYALVALLFGMGLTAKPQIITLPFVLLLWDYWPLQRMFPDSGSSAAPSGVYPPRSFSQLVKEKAPLLALCLMDALLTMKTQSGWRFKPPLPARLENATFSYWLYVKKAFWPTSMSPEYPHLARFLTAWQVVGAALLLLAITALVLKARRYRYLPVGWFWFLGTLIPTIGLMQVGWQGMADRYAYESFLGLFIMVCWGVSDWAEQRRISTVWLAGASAVVILALTSVTFRQIGYWQDDLTLWKHAALVVKHHWLAEDNAAAMLLREGKNDEAMAHFLRAATSNPTDSTSNIQIAQYEQKRGNFREEIARYQHALEDYDFNMPPGKKVEVLVNMAIAYGKLGDDTNAELCLRQARELQKHVE
jgi:protein O-mannosyl-transferase